VLWFAIALMPIWIVSRGGFANAPRAVFWFLLLTFFMHAGNAVGGPAWLSWMSDVVPGRVRGKFFARRRQWGIVAALPGAWLVGWILDTQASGAMQTLQWCAVIFMCAAVCGIMDVHLFHYVPDVPTRPRCGAGLLRAMAKPMRDRRFLLFAAFIGMMTFSLCFNTQFVALYLIEKLGVSSTQTQLMLIVGPMLAQLAILGVWGAAADRMGKRPVLVLAALGLIPVGFGWIFVDPSRLWLGYILMAAATALWTGVEVANVNIVMEAAGGDDGGTAYVATNSIIINIAGCLGGVAAGLIAQGLKDWTWHPTAAMKTFTSYDVLFVLSGVLRVACVIAFLPLLCEPRARSTLETFRFMLARLTAGVGSVLAFPAKLLDRPQHASPGAPLQANVRPVEA
jgi:MFS family permease